MSEESIISLKNVNKWFGGFTFGMSRYSLYLEKKLKTGINMGAD